MRLTELSIENYGGYSSRTIVIPETAGLAVIYGPNEAGKSTCLEAVSDFLFTIPKNTIRGNLYGYDGMRISASMRTSDDRLLSFRRRKGNGRTLSDADGNALDDAALAPILGAITRDRFETLFGLNHETLRGGGERLLQADGDIGRLIVEAGGGLRTLIGRLAAIDDEAGRLFDGRRSATRAFYQQLTAFEDAERIVKAGQFTRETYEQSSKLANAASAKLADLRDERRMLATRIARTERTIRVAPRLLELEGLVSSLEDVADIASYPSDFATRARAAVKALEDARGNARSAAERRDRIMARIGELKVSPELVAVESRIRDAAELSIHVAKARVDRTNRQREIDQGEAQLVALRRMLVLPADADLASMLPTREAVERVRALMTAATERRPAHAAARDRTAEIAETVSAIEARLSDARRDGFDTALETSSAQFSGIAVQKSSIDARTRNLDDEGRRIHEAAVSLGFEGMDALEAFVCPTRDGIAAEQVVRDGLEAQRVEQERIRRQASRDISAATADIASLESEGTIANDEAVSTARSARTAQWTPIRAAYVEGLPSGSEAERLHSVDVYEATLTGADQLADRRAEEAERAASLAQAQRRVAEANRTLDAVEEELSSLSQDLEGRIASFGLAFPSATDRYPILAALLAFVERRAQIIEQAAALRTLSAALSVDAALMEPAIELIGSSELRLGIRPVPEFATRLQALVAAHGRHEQRHADHLRECADVESLRSQRAAVRLELDRLDLEQTGFDAEWPRALADLGVTEATSLMQAGELIGEWASARGVLSAIAQTRQRLSRMEEDEARLSAAVTALGAELGIDVGTDCVAGAQLLKARWDANATLRTQCDGLLPDFEEAKLEVEHAELAVARCSGERLSLSEQVRVPDTGEGLSAAAIRFEQRMELVGAVTQTERTLVDLGGGLAIAALRAERGELDLDDLQATLQEDRARAAALEVEVEAAVLAEKAARDALAAYVAEGRVAGAVVERESAAAQMHQSLERYLELKTARDLVTSAMATIRAEQQDPLIRRASELFAASTRGEFQGVETDIDDKGNPVVKGRRANGGTASVATMSDGTRDQLFIAFRLASLENYGAATEPLPFLADDVLVHFDDDRSAATLELLAEFGRRNQGKRGR